MFTMLGSDLARGPPSPFDFGDHWVTSCSKLNPGQLPYLLVFKPIWSQVKYPIVFDDQAQVNFVTYTYQPPGHRSIALPFEFQTYDHLVTGQVPNLLALKPVTTLLKVNCISNWVQNLQPSGHRCVTFTVRSSLTHVAPVSEVQGEVITINHITSLHDYYTTLHYILQMLLSEAT